MKFLKRPLDLLIINQHFADDMACLNLKDKKSTIFKNTKDICPTGYASLYSTFGMKGHNGLDLRAKHGQEVYSSCEGFVEEVQTEEARGLGLGIVTEQFYFCNELQKETQFKIRYWHLKSFAVKKGDKVTKGQLIGYADNTGYSSGDHLHFEIKPVYIRKGVVTNLLQNNGYFGAVDPLQYIEEVEFKFNKNLVFLETSDDVGKMQELLIKLELLNIPKPTRFYGNLTKIAVMRFQNLTGIKTNYGIAVGEKTREKLNQFL